MQANFPSTWVLVLGVVLGTAAVGRGPSRNLFLDQIPSKGSGPWAYVDPLGDRLSLLDDLPLDQLAVETKNSPQEVKLLPSTHRNHKRGPYEPPSLGGQAKEARGGGCPPRLMPCRCRSVGPDVHVVCEGAGVEALERSLLRLMDGSMEIAELHLLGNFLPTLPSRFFGSLQVKKLLLSHNSISTVSRNALAGLQGSLEHLYIQEPLLMEMPFDTLDHLHELRTFVLQDTLVGEIPRLYPQSKLEYLRVENSRVAAISPAAFKLMTKLKKIHVSHSLIKEISQSSLEGLVHLRELNLSHNAIEWIHPRAFRTMELLEHISLSNNKLIDASTAVLPGREIRALKTLDLSYNKIKVLKKGTFVDMKKVEVVKLDGNYLEEIHPGAFSKLPSLTTLELKHNALRELHADIVDECPKLEHLYVSYNNLSHVSELKFFARTMPRLATLDLEGNRLKDRPKGAWGGHSALQVLKLGGNDIGDLEKKTFDDLPSLRELHISHNRIQNIPHLWNLPKLGVLDVSHNDVSNVTSQFLSGVPQLSSLDLAFNIITDIKKNAFLEVAYLKSLNLSFNKISDFPEDVFIGLRDLYSLDVSFNELRDIKDHYLKGLVSLEILTLSHNRVKRVGSGAFTDTPLLKSLDLSTNILERLPSSALRRLSSLRVLNLRRNAVGSIRGGDLTGLKILERLDVSNNHVQSLDKDAFSPLSVLRDLDVSSNYIQALPEGLLSPLHLVERINVSHNFLAQLSNDVFENNKRLRILDITNNSLTVLEGATTGLPALQGLFLSHNYIDRLSNSSFKDLPALNVLYFDNNGLQQFDSGTFDQLSSLVLLDLSFNSLVELNRGSFSSLESLRELKLDNNQITMVKDGALRELPALQSLELQDNLISFIGPDAVFETPAVRFLNLSKNALQEVPSLLLSAFPALDVLDLSWNFILDIDGTSFIQLDWLTVLMLHNNDICRLSDDAFSQQRGLRVLTLNGNQLRRLHLQALGATIRGLSLLDMSDNPFSCDCQLTWLRDFMEEEGERLVASGRIPVDGSDSGNASDHGYDEHILGGKSLSPGYDASKPGGKAPYPGYDELKPGGKAPYPGYDKSSLSGRAPSPGYDESKAGGNASYPLYRESTRRGNNGLGDEGYFQRTRAPLTKLQLLALQRLGLNRSHWTSGIQKSLRAARGSRLYSADRLGDLPPLQLPLTTVPTCAGPPQYAGKRITEVPAEAFLCEDNLVGPEPDLCMPRLLPPHFHDGPPPSGSFLDLSDPILLPQLASSVTPPPHPQATTTIIVVSSTPSHLDLQVTQQLTQKLPSTQSSADYNLVTGDTPTIYAGNPSNDSDLPQQTSLFPGLPSLPSILETIGSISNLKLPNIGLNVNWANLPVGRIEHSGSLASKSGMPVAGTERRKTSVSASNPALWIHSPNGPILNPIFSSDLEAVPSLENPKKIYPNPSASEPAEEGRASPSHVKFPEDRLHAGEVRKGPNPENFIFPDDPPRMGDRVQSVFGFPPSENVPSRRGTDRKPMSPPRRNHPLPSIVHSGPSSNSGRPFLPGLLAGQSHSRPGPAHIIRSRPGVASVTKVNTDETKSRGQTNHRIQWSTPEVINPLSGVSLYQPSEQFKPYQPPRSDSPIRIITPPHQLVFKAPGLVPPKQTKGNQNPSNILKPQLDNSEILSYLDPTSSIENNPVHVEPFVPEFSAERQSAVDIPPTTERLPVVSSTVFFPDSDQAFRLSSTPNLNIPGLESTTISTSLKDNLPPPPLTTASPQHEDPKSNNSASSTFPVGISDDQPHSIDDILDLLYGSEAEAVPSQADPSVALHVNKTSQNSTFHDASLGMSPPARPQVPINVFPAGKIDAVPPQRAFPDFRVTTDLPMSILPPSNGWNLGGSTTEFSASTTTTSQRPPTVYGSIKSGPTPVPISESLGSEEDFAEPQLGLGVSVVHGKPSPEKVHKFYMEAAEAASQAPGVDDFVQISPDLGNQNLKLGEGPLLDNDLPVTRYAEGLTDADPSKAIQEYGLGGGRLRGHSLFTNNALVTSLRYGTGSLLASSSGGLVPPSAPASPVQEKPKTLASQDTFYDYRDSVDQSHVLPAGSGNPPFGSGIPSSVGSRNPSSLGSGIPSSFGSGIPSSVRSGNPSSFGSGESIGEIGPSNDYYDVYDSSGWRSPPSTPEHGPTLQESFVPSLNPSMVAPPPQRVDEISDPQIALRQQHPQQELPIADPLQEDSQRLGTLEKDSKDGPSRGSADWYYENYFKDYSNSSHIPVGGTTVTVVANTATLLAVSLQCLACAFLSVFVV